MSKFNEYETIPSSQRYVKQEIPIRPPNSGFGASKRVRDLCRLIIYPLYCNRWVPATETTLDYEFKLPYMPTTLPGIATPTDRQANEERSTDRGRGVEVVPETRMTRQRKMSNERTIPSLAVKEANQRIEEPRNRSGQPQGDEEGSYLIGYLTKWLQTKQEQKLQLVCSNPYAPLNMVDYPKGCQRSWIDRKSAYAASSAWWNARRTYDTTTKARNSLRS